MIVVVIIVGVLAAIETIGYSSFTKNSRQTAVVASARAIGDEVAALTATSDTNPGQADVTTAAAPTAAGGRVGVGPLAGAHLRSSGRPLTRYEHPTCGDLVHVDVKKTRPRARRRMAAARPVRSRQRTRQRIRLAQRRHRRPLLPPTSKPPTSGTQPAQGASPGPLPGSSTTRSP
jgi:hypothetical protein